MNRKLVFILILAMMLPALNVLAERSDVLIPKEVFKRDVDPNDQKIVNYGFHSLPSRRNLLNLERDNPWSLPKASSINADGVDTIRICAMRFDFIEEVPDEDSTTGNGKYDMRSYEEFVNEELHAIDPAPHNKAYFESQLRALRNYYRYISGGKLELVYTVFPEGENDAYHLPHQMRYYGEVNPAAGLTQYFIDCFLLADTVDESIVFGDYDSYFLFHAGSDRQNDIYPDEFPPSGDTPFDLFTGYIFLLGDTALGLDKVYSGNEVVDSTEITDALIMPETASQDNRATALNAVMAHEFGHQLGLIDLYRTDNFFTRIGDFGLMDNNGFGTGVDFGFDVGRAFGVFPVYPMAWSRAFLGFDTPVTYRQGTSIPVAAAEMQSNFTKIAKIPISEYEYYLIENRQIDIDDSAPSAWADHNTGVILGPIKLDTINEYPNFDTTITGEYDFLLPGSGMLIWKIDEEVAYMDYDGDGYLNFLDNQLQNNPDRPFVKLIEADGLVNFGKEYYSGYGTQEDMFYKPNATAFTPNTNPPTIAHGGANTHIYISNISTSGKTMTFDVDNGFASLNFPQRLGVPTYGLSPVAGDFDGDGETEIAAVSGNRLIVVKEDGTDYNPGGEDFIDTAYILARDFPEYTVPIFALTEDTITAGPVVGDFGTGTNYIAIGAGPWLHVYTFNDVNADGRADPLFAGDSINVDRDIVWMSFGEELVVATMDAGSNEIRLIGITSEGAQYPLSPFGGGRIYEPELYGACRVYGHYALIGGDSTGITLYYVLPDTAYSFDLEGYYNYGPVAADLNRDSLYEVVAATPDGEVKVITIDTSLAEPLSLYDEYDIGEPIYSNPVVADLDRNGYVDIILGGLNKIYAFDKNFVNLLNFPLTIDRAQPYDLVFSSPVIGDINHDGIKDIVTGTSAGSIYAFSSSHSYNEELISGFPISAGGVAFGSPVLFDKDNGGGLGFVGIDGWLYSYDVDFNEDLADWPMGGGGPSGIYTLENDKVAAPSATTEMLPDDKFFAYPNPSYDGSVNFYYELGGEAEVSLTVFDLSGKIVNEGSLPGRSGRTDQNYDLSALPTGVYRCIIEADFTSGETVSAFTDVAIIK